MVLRLQWEYIPPAEVRGNSRAHWAKRHRVAREMRDSAYAQCLGRPTLGRISVRCLFQHWREVDLDNLSIGAKPWIDGVVDAGLVPDDSPRYVRIEAPEFERCKKGESRTVMEVRTWR